MNQETISVELPKQKIYAIRSSDQGLQNASPIVLNPISTTRNYVATPKLQSVQTRRDWLDPEFRQAYMEAAVEQGVAWQVKANRTKRGLSQAELGGLIDSTQSGISRIEDPEYGKHSIETLVKIAHAFDCALSIKFISYSDLAKEAEDLSPEALFATPFCQESTLIIKANE